MSAKAQRQIFFSTGRYVGVTGDYTFQWQYVVDAEDGGVSGRVVDFKGGRLRNVVAM